MRTCAIPLTRIDVTCAWNAQEQLNGEICVYFRRCHLCKPPNNDRFIPHRSGTRCSKLSRKLYALLIEAMFRQENHMYFGYRCLCFHRNNFIVTEHIEVCVCSTQQIAINSERASEFLSTSEHRTQMGNRKAKHKQK